jgi:DNA (cytosine-5)-methyltransferase 3A
MNVLSLFDGISCARVSLDRAGIEVNAYMSSEIDKNAIKISEKNYPDIIRVGSVVGLEVEGQIDLLIGGSPCQDLSIAKKDRKGLEGNRSSLFWEYVRIKKECNPTWFVLENVASMPKADRDIITREMGVEPVMFNASLVSAQSRKRLFWTNIPFSLPVDRGILLKDILEAEVGEKFYIKKEMKANGKTTGKVGYVGEGEQYGQGGQAHRVYSTDGKTPTMSSGPALVYVGAVEGTTRKGMEGQEHLSRGHHEGNRIYDPEGKAPTLSANGGGTAGSSALIKEEARIRKLTPIECERLQGLPDNYTEGVATTNRYKYLGNAFNVDVVAHILNHLHILSLYR